MKKFTKYVLAMCVAMVALVACDNKDVLTGSEPIITIAPEVEVVAAGGEYSVNYSVANSVEGAALSVKEDVEWIVDVSVEANKICFTVAANRSEAQRTATISVEYPKAKSKSLTVKQLGADGAFAITIEEVHAASAITEVTPKDNDMFYIMYLEEVSYFQSGNITTPELLWEDDYYAFENGAIRNGMSLKAYMEAVQVVFKGAQRVQWNKVLPGIKSVLYIYGVKFSEDGTSYEPVTDISWAVIEPDYAPLQDVNFDLSVAVNGAEVELSIKPESWDGYYLVKIVDGNDILYLGDDATITDEFMKSIADEWIVACSSNLSGGRTLQEVLDGIAYTGNKVISTELSSYTLYTALVYPIAEYDGYYQVVAKPSYYNFSTEQVQQSDLDINIEVSNCYVRVADLRITPSNPEEAYTLMITPTAYLPAGYDSQTLLDLALGQFSSFTYNFKGVITTHLNTLYPDTEYIVVAFGYSGGVVTTDVCSKIFKTEPESECQITITDVVVGGPYRPSDLYNYDPEEFRYYAPNYAPNSAVGVITIEVKTSEPTRDLFASPFSVMDYEWAGHETIFYDLLIDTCPEFSVYDVIYDYAPYYICAAAFDYKGNVTPMWMSDPINYTSGNTKPIEEFIEKWEANQNMQVMTLSIVR